MAIFSKWRAHMEPVPSEFEAGVFAFYHVALEPIGNDVNCWRLRNERDREFAFRIAVEISDRLNKLEADLDRVINYDKR